MKTYWSRLLALILVITIGLIGCSGTPDSLTGDYRQDTLAVVKVMRQAVEVSPDDPNKAAIQAEARQKINDFSARYQRSSSVSQSRYPPKPLPKLLQWHLLYRRHTKLLVPPFWIFPNRNFLLFF